jgi:hypothetical protein
LGSEDEVRFSPPYTISTCSGKVGAAVSVHFLLPSVASFFVLILFAG